MTPKEQITEIVHQMFKDHVCGQPIPLPRHISAKIEPAISSALESRERALAKKMFEAAREQHLYDSGNEAVNDALKAMRRVLTEEGITIE